MTPLVDHEGLTILEPHLASYDKLLLENILCIFHSNPKMNAMYMLVHNQLDVQIFIFILYF